MLRQLLLSIRNHAPEMLDSTLLVDDASPLPGTLTILSGLREEFGIRFRRKIKNAGYSSSINMAINWARRNSYAALITVNQDIEFVKPFMEQFQAGLDVADVVGGLLWYPTGRIQSAGFEIHADSLMPVEYHKNERLVNAVGSEAAKARYVMGVTGALQAFRIQPAVSYPGKYSLGYEDVDFCLKAWEHGRRVLFVPAIEAIHHESAIRGYFPGPRELESIDTWAEAAREFDFPMIRLAIRVANSSLNT